MKQDKIRQAFKAWALTLELFHRFLSLSCWGGGESVVSVWAYGCWPSLTQHTWQRTPGKLHVFFIPSCNEVTCWSEVGVSAEPGSELQLPFYISWDSRSLSFLPTPLSSTHPCLSSHLTQATVLPALMVSVNCLLVPVWTLLLRSASPFSLRHLLPWPLGWREDKEWSITYPQRLSFHYCSRFRCYSMAAALSHLHFEVESDVRVSTYGQETCPSLCRPLSAQLCPRSAGLPCRKLMSGTGSTQPQHFTIPLERCILILGMGDLAWPPKWCRDFIQALQLRSRNTCFTALDLPGKQQSWGNPELETLPLSLVIWYTDS